MNKKQRTYYNVITALALAATAWFALYWFNPVNIPNNFSGWGRIIDFVIYVGVTYVIWHPIIMEVLSWAIASQIKPTEHIAPSPGLRVAFITTFVPNSEPIELLHKALPAMLAADYDHDVWLLDEGDDAAAKEYCKQIGVHYFTRHGRDHYNGHKGKFAKKTKGGNHNAWYDMHGDNYDIVAQIDTDFVPRNDFLTKTLGYFRDPNVAFVGTPQIYGNTAHSLIARGAAQQTYNFYGPILRGLYGMDMTFLIGANHVIRVKSLKKVDHYSAHLTEDLLTGMKLHAQGWTSIYVHEPLAIGEGPSTWQAYFNQQMRWAHGCMHILLHHSPGLFKRMTVRQRVYYYFIQQHYFSGLAMMLSILGLSLYFFLGLNPADLNLHKFLLHYIPVILISGYMALWLQRFNVRPKLEKGLLLAGKIVSLAVWPIFFLAFIGVLRGKHLTFKVTPKGAKGLRNRDRVNLNLFKPHLAIMIICMLCLIYGEYKHHTSAVMVFWAATTATIMVIVPFSTQIASVIQDAKKKLF